MAGKRCARAGCRAWAMRGGEFCRAHAGAPTRRAADEGDEEREAFSERLAGGDYRALLTPELTRILAQAGAESSLTEEIGALRVVLKRLVDEVNAQGSDAHRLSESIPRVVSATVRAVKAQRAIAGETAGDLTEALTRVLIELGLGE